MASARCRALCPELKLHGRRIVDKFREAYSTTSLWRVGMRVIAEGKFGPVISVHPFYGSMYIQIQYDDGGDFDTDTYEARLLEFG